ncbi:ATP-binding protein [Streptomyces caniscabiei]|uniref:ATP-binding protein n=1 Tax=Streptomyces caniscabiei TaxID=2746961 RepID=A0ABU4MPN2_9ACTN|nr:ATP-binding protein [Streptomyces caniscabiei]MDX2986402.1 ATP-binding protein [Streptomyces caniscabiei]MDX3039406.1 ATP-binding protein [Streptomyces caniscabiei]
MNKPQSLAENRPSMLARLMAGIANHAPDVTAGPIDDQPTPDEPGHPEYHRRRRAEFALTRWQTAVPYRYRNATAEHPTVQAWADRAATDIRDAGILVLHGNIGTGKTHQAYGALRRIAEAGPKRFEMIATTAPDLYGLLRPGGSDKGSEHELKRLCRIPLLLLDDLGTEKLSEFTEETTTRIVNYRYNESLPLLITTNLPIQTGAPTPDLVTRLGDRLASRLAQTATIVSFNGPDRRRTLRSVS